MIIVLTLSRSGSSLMMQTLKIIGIEVIGTDFCPGVKAEHNRLNPKGFYELPDIFAKGLKHLSLDSSISYHRKALKMHLYHLSCPNQWQEWFAWNQSIEQILITIREPLEQAHSNYRLLNHHKTLSTLEMKQQMFVFVIKFLKQYVSHFLLLAKALENELEFLQPKISLVDYHHPISDPQGYVENLISLLMLQPTSDQKQCAIDNIERDLYKFREEAFLIHQKQWAAKTFATEVYQTMIMTSGNQVWKELLRLETIISNKTAR